MAHIENFGLARQFPGLFYIRSTDISGWGDHGLDPNQILPPQILTYEFLQRTCWDVTKESSDIRSQILLHLGKPHGATLKGRVRSRIQEQVVRVFDTELATPRDKNTPLANALAREVDNWRATLVYALFVVRYYQDSDKTIEGLYQIEIYRERSNKNLKPLIDSYPV